MASTIGQELIFARVDGPAVTGEGGDTGPTDPSREIPPVHPAAGEPDRVVSTRARDQFPMAWSMR